MTERILLVEADEVLGQVLAEVLGREGYELIRAKNFRDAFRRDRREPVRTMIIDLDTVPIRRSLLGNYPWSGSSISPSIVLFSVQPLDDLEKNPLAQWCRQSGQEPTWILKPFRNEDFLAAVRKTVSESP